MMGTPGDMTCRRAFRMLTIVDEFTRECPPPPVRLANTLRASRPIHFMEVRLGQALARLQRKG